MISFISGTKEITLNWGTLLIQMIFASKLFFSAKPKNEGQIYMYAFSCFCLVSIARAWKDTLCSQTKKSVKVATVYNIVGLLIS